MKGTRFNTVFPFSMNNFFIAFLSFSIIIAASCSTSQPNGQETTVPAQESPAAEEKPEQTAATEEDEFTVTEEIYTKTFSDIESLIEKLNNIIRRSDFEEWKKYLTPEYMDYYSNQENLRAISETPTLVKYRIVLRSLRDYFNFVVVPSRSDVRLDEISFIDDNNIKAYMQIDEEPVVLYTLVKTGDNWKIGL